MRPAGHSQTDVRLLDRPLRQIVAPAAVFWLLTRLLGVGLTGIWWGIFGINWSAAAVAWLYARRQLKNAGTGV